MLYSEQYPELKYFLATINNFEFVARAVDRYLPDLFSLHALNSAVKNNTHHAYLNAFAMLVENLRELYTAQEVAHGILDQLNQQEGLISFFCSSLVFAPPAAKKNTLQMGVLEKMALGSLPLGESLTLLDMLRALRSIKQSQNKRSFKIASVLLLQALSEQQVASFITKTTVVIMNVSLDLDALPKWAVFFRKNEKSIVSYCETTITDDERIALKSIFPQQTLSYQQSGSSSIATTGHTALVWIDEKVVMNNYDEGYVTTVMAEFSYSLSHCISLQAPISANFILESGAYNELSNAFKFMYGLYAPQLCSPQGVNESSVMADVPNTLFNDIACMALTGRVLDQKTCIGDVCGIIETVYTQQSTIAMEHIQKEVLFAQSTNPIHLMSALKAIPVSGKAKILSISKNLIPLRAEFFSTDTLTFNVTYQRFITDYSAVRNRYDPGVITQNVENLFDQTTALALFLLSAARHLSNVSSFYITPNIDFPLEWSNERRDLFIRLLENNPYINNIEVMGSTSPRKNEETLCQSMQDSVRVVKNSLKEVFARNAFLRTAGYQPSLIDNYWQKASEYWLLYLLDASQGMYTEKFYSIKDMQVCGVKHLCDFLSKEKGRKWIEERYRSARPAFHILDMASTSTIEMLTILYNYLLNSTNFFPFSILVIEDGFKRDYTEMLPILLNIAELGRFKSIDIGQDKYAKAKFELAADFENYPSYRLTEEKLFASLPHNEKIIDLILTLAHENTALSSVIRFWGIETYNSPIMFMFPGTAQTKDVTSTDREQKRYDTAIQTELGRMNDPRMQYVFRVISEKHSSKTRDQADELIALFAEWWPAMISLVPEFQCDVFDLLGHQEMRRFLKKILKYCQEFSTEKARVAFLGDPQKYRETRDAYTQLKNRILINKRQSSEYIDSVAIGTRSNVENPSETEPPHLEVASIPSIFSSGYYGAFHEEHVWSKHILGSHGGVEQATHTTRTIQATRETQKAAHVSSVSAEQTKRKSTLITDQLFTYENLACVCDLDREDRVCARDIQFFTEDYINEEFSRNAAQADAYFKGESSVSGSATTLQHIFATYITHANPSVPSPYLIRQCTKKALTRILPYLRKGVLSSGFTDIQSGGFYTTTMNGLLTLCYDPLYRETNTHPLVLNLDVYNTIPKEEWEGDHRQFALEQYYANDSNTRALESLHKTLFDLVKKEQPRDTADASLSEELKAVASDILLGKDHDLKWWFAALIPTQRHLYAWGQLYYTQGSAGIEGVVKKFHAIEKKLGTEFFGVFYRDVLSKNEDYTHYFSSACFTAIDQMLTVLVTNNHYPATWLSFSRTHMQKVACEPMDRLWNGFAYFLEKLAEMGVTLDSATVFDGLKPQNILVPTYGFLKSLACLSDFNERQALLNNFSQVDWHAFNHEKMCHYSPKLQLHDFYLGTPIYVPTGEFLFSSKFSDYKPTDQQILLARFISAQPQLTQASYQYLLDLCFSPESSSIDTIRDILMWMVRTDYDAATIESKIEQLKEMDPITRAFMAQCFAVNETVLPIDFDAMYMLSKVKEPGFLSKINSRYYICVLEYIAIFYQSTLPEDRLRLPDIWNSLLTSLTQDVSLTHDFFAYGLKLLALFEQSEWSEYTKLHSIMQEWKPIVKQEVLLLIKQLQSGRSISIENGSPGAFSENWTSFIQHVENMQCSPEHASTIRMAFMTVLSNQGWCFSYNAAADFKAFEDADNHVELARFPNLADRFRSFFAQHVAVQIEEDAAKTSYLALIEYFHALQLKPTPVNQLTTLLSYLEEAAQPKHYWSADYLLKILQLLTPASIDTIYPLSMLQLLLREPFFQATTMDTLEHTLPEIIEQFLTNLMKDEALSRSEQTMLAQLALREAKNGHSLKRIEKLLTDLALWDDLSMVLTALVKTDYFDRLYEIVGFFLALKSKSDLPDFIVNHLMTTALSCIKVAANDAAMCEWFLAVVQTEKSYLWLHIVVHGYLDREDTIMFNQEDRVAILHVLTELDDTALYALAQYYPMHPSLSLKRLYDDRLLVKESTGITITDFLTAYDKNPNHELVILNENGLSVSNLNNLDRMLSLLEITSKGERRSLYDEESNAIKTKLYDIYKAEETHRFLNNMTRAERVECFYAYKKVLKEGKPDSDTYKAASSNMWALLFAVTSIATQQYPHLSQQIAAVASDILSGDAKFTVVLLSTSEGKTLLNALRAIWVTFTDDHVMVLTPKQTLANKDYSYAQKIFNYLGITSSYTRQENVPECKQDVNLRRAIEAYQQTTIRYSTLSEYWGLLVSGALRGYSFYSYEAKTTFILDEFDYLIFVEAYTTLHNKAEILEGELQDMDWFHDALLNFYDTHDVATRAITLALLRELYQVLTEHTQGNVKRQAFINNIFTSIEAVAWVQRLCAARSLTRNQEFVVTQGLIPIQDEHFNLGEIVPLTTDNQLSEKALFSDGVQPLVAKLLNNISRNGELMCHVPPSTQTMTSLSLLEELRHWPKIFGTSGSSSTHQLALLNQNYGANILHMPTNAPVQRKWVQPICFADKMARLSHIVETIKECFEKKQSMLFLRQSDAAVIELSEALKGLLSAEHLKYFDFYLNEEKRKVTALLQEKKKKEYGGDNKKQHASALVASGLGRGENLDIQVVEILDLCSAIALIQTAGRAGRREGEYGVVYQHYLEPELHAAERNIEERLAVFSISFPNIELKENETTEDFLQRRLARFHAHLESIFMLENELSTAYYRVVSTFSRAFITLIADKTMDEQKRDEMSTAFYSVRNDFDDAWRTISSDMRLSNEEKIQQLVERTNTLFSTFEISALSKSEFHIDFSSLKFGNELSSFHSEDRVERSILPIEKSNDDEWSSFMQWIPSFINGRYDRHDFTSEALNDLHSIWRYTEYFVGNNELYRENLVPQIAALTKYARTPELMRTLLQWMGETAAHWLKEKGAHQALFESFWINIGRHAVHIEAWIPVIETLMKEGSIRGFTLCSRIFSLPDSMIYYKDRVLDLLNLEPANVDDAAENSSALSILNKCIQGIDMLPNAKEPHTALAALEYRQFLRYLDFVRKNDALFSNEALKEFFFFYTERACVTNMDDFFERMTVLIDMTRENNGSYQELLYNKHPLLMCVPVDKMKTFLSILPMLKPDIRDVLLNSTLNTHYLGLLIYLLSKHQYAMSIDTDFFVLVSRVIQRDGTIIEYLEQLLAPFPLLMHNTEVVTAAKTLLTAVINKQIQKSQFSKVVVLLPNHSVQFQIIAGLIPYNERIINNPTDFDTLLSYVRRSRTAMLVDPLPQKEKPLSEKQLRVMQIIMDIDKTTFFTLPSDEAISTIIIQIAENNDSILRHLASDPEKYEKAQRSSRTYLRECCRVLTSLSQLPTDNSDKDTLISNLSGIRDTYCEEALSHDRSFLSQCARLFMAFWTNLIAALTLGIAHVVHYYTTGKMLFFGCTESEAMQNSYQRDVEDMIRNVAPAG